MKKIISIILSIIMVVSAMLVVPTTASATSEKAKALSAYKNYLQKNSSSISKFSIIYLDNNSVPDLLTCEVYEYGSAILHTYKNGKIEDMTCNITSTEWEGNFKYYKKTGVFLNIAIQNGISTYSYPKLTGTKIKSTIWKSGSLMGSSGFKYYKLNSNNKTSKISKSTFNSKLKKLTKGKKVTTAKFYKNTKANRKKHLK
jgi:hypothetical protein